MRRFIKRCNQPVSLSLSLFSFCICVRDFLEKKEEESSSASSCSSSSYFILRVPHGSLWLASADWNTTDRPPHVTGFTFQQQVSVLSAAAEKTRQRARWCSGYRREPHTQTHTHERECAVHRRAGEKNTTVADQVAIKTVHSDPCLSLSLQFFEHFFCLFFSYFNNFHRCVVLLSCKIIYKSS